MTTNKHIRGTGELLPQLKKFLEYRAIPHRQLNIAHQHTGYTNDRAVFVAKKQVWRDQVSTQKYLVQKSIEKARWIIFFIPKVGILCFDPKVFHDNAWQNKRGDEFMLNVSTKFGKWLSNEELQNLKPLEYNVETQLELS